MDLLKTACLIFVFLSQIGSVAAQEVNRKGSEFTSFLEKLDNSFHFDEWDEEINIGLFVYDYVSGNPLVAITNPRTEDRLNDDKINYLVSDVFTQLGMYSYSSSGIPVNRTINYSTALVHLADQVAREGEWRKISAFSDKASRSFLNDDDSQRLMFLKSSAYSANNLPKSAMRVINEMDPTNPDYIFANFNLMLSYMRSGINSMALQGLVSGIDFSKVKSERFTQKDITSLMDRFYVTAGKYELDRGKYKNSIFYFRKISKNGAYTDEGLLHYGWALAKQWQFDQALQPWRALQSSYSLSNLNVLESIMAMAYVIELKKGGSQSLGIYEYSERKLEQALENIERLSNEKKVDEWILSWSNPVSEDIWWENQHLTIGESSHSIALEQLLVSGEFDIERERLIALRKMSIWVANKYKEASDLIDLQMAEARDAYSKLEKAKAKVEELKYRKGLDNSAGENRSSKKDMVSALLDESEIYTVDAKLNQAIWELNVLVKYYEGLPGRINKSKKILVNLNAKARDLATAVEFQRSVVKNIVLTHLGIIKAQLKGYLSNTRLSIARLYDEKFRSVEEELQAGSSDE